MLALLLIPEGGFIHLDSFSVYIFFIIKILSLLKVQFYTNGALASQTNISLHTHLKHIYTTVSSVSAGHHLTQMRKT